MTFHEIAMKIAGTKSGLDCQALGFYRDRHAGTVEFLVFIENQFLLQQEKTTTGAFSIVPKFNVARKWYGSKSKQKEEKNGEKS